jgi:hypothetical protein
MAALGARADATLSMAADAAARSFHSVVMSSPIGRDAATDMAVSVRASPDRGDPDAVAGYREGGGAPKLSYLLTQVESPPWQKWNR